MATTVRKVPTSANTVRIAAALASSAELEQDAAAGARPRMLAVCLSWAPRSSVPRSGAKEVNVDEATPVLLITGACVGPNRPTRIG